MRGCARKERRGEVGDLRLQRHLPLAQPLDQRRVQHVPGRIERGALVEKLLHGVGPRLGFRPRRPRPRELRVHVAELLGRKIAAAAAGASGVGVAGGAVVEVVETMARAVIGDRLLGVRDAPAQLFDLLLQPFGRLQRRLALGVLLQLDEGVGDRVGDVGGELRLRRREFVRRSPATAAPERRRAARSSCPSPAGGWSNRSGCCSSPSATSSEPIIEGLRAGSNSGWLVSFRSSMTAFATSRDFSTCTWLWIANSSGAAVVVSTG